MRNIKKIITNRFNEYHFILLWTLFNIFQIWTTELTSDEGYYWFYSSILEWGYYDHPPLLAVLIKLGTLISNEEIGVRLFNVLLMSAGLFFLFKITQPDRRTKKLIYLIILSIPLFNYITFIAFPDTPLVAFSIICLYAYKRLLEKKDLISSLLLGFSIALMLYSKYHAILFVFFMLLSNLSLLKNKYFYLAIFLAFILFIPHLIWQKSNDFPSLIYHLHGRSTLFDFHSLDDYLLQQIPIIGIGIIFIPFIYKPGNQFEKTLKYIALGTLIFFLLSTLKGFVHIHWTSIILFPVIILSANYYSAKRNDRLFNYLIIPFIVSIMIARLYLSFHIFPINVLNSDYYHGRKLWAEDIETIAGERPLVTEDGPRGYKEAALYSYYSGNLGIALYAEEYRKTQYQIWNYEDTVQLSDVILVKRLAFEESEELHTRMGKLIHYKEIDDFSSYQNIKINWNVENIVQERDTVRIPLEIINHRMNPLQFTSNIRIYSLFKNKAGKLFEFERPLNFLCPVPAGDTAKINFSFSSKELNEDNYSVIFGIKDGILKPSVNSRRKKLLIVDRQPV